MIYPFLSLLADAFKSGLQGLVDPRRIVVGHAPPSGKPSIVIHSGAFQIVGKALESQNSEPRPQDKRQEFVVDPLNPNKPYLLEKQPIEGSVVCKVIYHQGEVGEFRKLFVQGKDFSINPAVPSITFIKSILGASHFVLKYPFVGVFTIRDFIQDVLIDIYANGPEDASQLSSLCGTIALTNVSELKETYNAGHNNQYASQNYASLHAIHSVIFVGAEDIPPENPEKLQIKFEIKGQLKAVKSISDGFGFIEKIKSPGKVSDLTVDIDIDLE